MTVKEVCGILKTAKTIALGWNGASIEFEKSNPLMMDAYGNYVVDSIEAVGDSEDGYYEVNIAAQPMKVGA